MNTLLSAVGDWFAQNWFILLIIVLMVAMLVPSFLRQKKEMNARNELFDKLKKGTRVITTAGVYGVVESIELTTDGKVVTIVTGNAKNPTTMTIHINAIGGIDNKTPVVEDENGNVVETKISDTKEAESTEIQTKNDKIEEQKPMVEASKLSALVDKVASNKVAKSTTSTKKSSTSKTTSTKKGSSTKSSTSKANSKSKK